MKTLLPLQFYRELGIWNVTQLASGPLRFFRGFPKDTVVHILDRGEHPVLDVAAPIFQGFSTPLPLQFTHNVASKPKTFRFKPTQVGTFSRDVRTHSKLFRPVQNIHALKTDPNVPLIIDYNPLKASFIPLSHPLEEMRQWEFLEGVRLEGVRNTCIATARTSYIVLPVFEDLPSFSLLTAAEKLTDLAFNRLVNSDDRRWVYAIHAFIKDKPSILSVIDSAHWDRVVLVFMTADFHAVALTLGRLKGFVKGNPNPFRSQQISADWVTKAFLKLHLRLFQSGIKEEDTPETKDSDFEESSEEERPGEEVAPETDEKGLETLVAKDLEFLEARHQVFSVAPGTRITVSEKPEIVPRVSIREKTVASVLNENLQARVKNGTLSASAVETFQKTCLAYENQKSPYGDAETVSQMVEIRPEALTLGNQEVASSAMQRDPTLNKSTLIDFDREYVQKHLRNDVIKAVHALQKSGVAIKNHTVEFRSDVTGATEEHRLELQPIDGAASVVYFKLPVLDDDGKFRVGGNVYFLKKQRVDVPIRKISATEVCLSSYYGKTFVSTETTARTSYSQRVIRNLMQRSLNKKLDAVALGNVADYEKDHPFLYTVIASQFQSFTFNEIRWSWESNEARAWCGVDAQGRRLWVEKDHGVYREAKTPERIGSLVELLNIPSDDIRFSEISIFQKNVPVILLLGYHWGLSAVLRELEVRVEWVDSTKPIRDVPGTWSLRFKNATAVFSDKDLKAKMILMGLVGFSDLLKQYDREEFDKPNVYFNLLASKGFTSIYFREIDALFSFFVDPTTQEVLRSMKEPETFTGLLIRASEILLTHQHPKNYDGRYFRIRGYERMAGIVYKELARAVRQYRGKNITGRAKVDISPWKIWQEVNEDPTKTLSPDVNPLQDLKNQEGLTYVGEGGRSADGFTKAGRTYDVHDLGTISEGTVDSAYVGVNLSVSANPTIKNLRGMIDHKKEWSNNELHTSPVLMAPGFEFDSANRVNFISIQASHVIAADGYHVPYLRTGFETILPQRCTRLFAVYAKTDCTVESVDEFSVVVVDAQKKKTGINVGRQYGRHEGVLYPLDIVTPLKKGQKVLKGSVIAYCKNFFEPDIYNPGQLVTKNSATARTVIWEVAGTHEDANMLSNQFVDRLKTRTTHLRNIVVRFSQNVYQVAQPGSRVIPRQPLLVLEDEISSESSLFSDESLERLKELAGQVLMSQHDAVVDRVEVFYNGDIETMSKTLQQLVEQSDETMKKRVGDRANQRYTGETTAEYRVNGDPLLPGTAEIRFYLTYEQAMGGSDKCVFANQMKSVTSRVNAHQLFTESGDPIDAEFSARSIAARVVISPYLIGTTVRLIRFVTRQLTTQYGVS